MKSNDFERYESKFKSLADEQRLRIVYGLAQRKTMCVGELCECFQMEQSKMSYHLKILLNEQLIQKEIKGTWSYYRLNEEEIRKLLSLELCCVLNICLCCQP